MAPLFYFYASGGRNWSGPAAKISFAASASLASTKMARMPVDPLISSAGLEHPKMRTRMPQDSKSELDDGGLDIAPGARYGDKIGERHQGRFGDKISRRCAQKQLRVTVGAAGIALSVCFTAVWTI